MVRDELDGVLNETHLIALQYFEILASRPFSVNSNAVHQDAQRMALESVDRLEAALTRAEVSKHGSILGY